MSSYNITYNTSARICSRLSKNSLTPQHVLPIFTARVSALLLGLFFACSGAWAQQTANHYTDTYTYTNSSGTDVTVDNIGNISIAHKPAKWYSFRQAGVDYHDSFDAENSMTKTLNGVEIQATNTYVDTIYMHKGTSINIDIPQTNNAGGTDLSTKGYILWYDFRTGGNLYCNYSNDGTTIYDLLTLRNPQTYTFYRFANGYAGGRGLTESNRLLQHMSFYYPTDEEFEAMKRNESFPAVDNNYYVLACDVSLYNDFAEDYEYGGSTFGGENDWYEPTLCGRDMYYIIGVEDDTTHRPEAFKDYWHLLEEDYQGGGNTGEEHYLEEYEITFPAFHFSNYTDELVTLTKDAQAYAIPGGSDTSSTPLTVTFADNDNDQEFQLTGNGTISGTNRVIQFYSGTTQHAWRVEDGTTATILVTKEVGETIYNIARYKLTFKHESSPLTQTQVDRLDNIVNGETVDDSYWWDDLTERSYIYMNNNYHLLTSLKFDYSEDGNSSNVFEGGKSQFYAFPLAWDNCGYAFYDGCANDDVYNGDDSGYSINSTTTGFTRWGMYSITNSYIASGSNGYATVPTDEGKHDTTYWMYIDASDRPGSIAELTFDEKLCQGSKLYVSGWLKSENNSSTADDGAVLLTIMGVSKDENGNEVHTPIHRHCSGQIRFTGTPLDGAEQPDEPTPGRNNTVTGKGTGHNQWCQFYFTFINSGNEDYDYYTLKVENYCASSTGGDFNIDDIEVYVLHPSVEMVQFDQICSTSGDEKSAMRLDIDYEAIMSRLGLDPLDYEDETEETAYKTIGSVDFVILNEAKYRNLLADTENTMTEEEAFEASLVTFSDPQGGEHQFPTLDFYCNYDLNTEYGEEGTNIIEFSGEEGYFYRRDTDAGVQYLSVDCLTDMQAYTEYVILLEPHTETDKDSDQKLEEFIELLDNDCAIKTEFFMSATTILKVNGETVDPTVDYCAGQEFVISPEVTYTTIDDDGNTVTVYLDGVYFDWFFGSVEEYTAANETYGGVSLEGALIAFRTYYPDAEELSDATPVTGEDGVDGAFTKNHYDIIAYYLSQTRYGGINNMLVLHKSHLDMRVLNTGLELVIQPIEITDYDENGEPLVDICFAYVPLTLYASGDAPTIKAGFSNINYPDNDYEPCLRLGLAQFEQCSEDTPFTINLHGATYVTEADENGETIEIDHLGVADGMDMLFLVDTDDPAYRDIILGKADEEEIVIGKVTRLYAKDDNSNDPRTDAPSGVEGSYMQIYFYGDVDDLEDSGVTSLTVREGYYYVVSVYFQEKGAFDDENNDEPVGSVCWGTFPLEIKVVPEYLVWTGDSTCNWNNDNHWQRVSSSRINGTITEANSSYFTDGNNSNTNGFVPMLFSKVIMPRDGEAELYMAGFIADGTVQGDETTPMLSWEGDEDTENDNDVSEHPTSNIMYDMMLYENPTTSALKTEHYRVNLCDELHFEPGAQLLHSEQLIYNKAWTDVELEQTPWTLVSTPLRDVVSGDWYTKSATGTETAEYFTDITFNSTDNDRLDPMVYQRNWSNEGNKIIYNSSTDNDKDVPAYVSTGWSSVYNDVTIPHQPGEGFSIKASRSLPVSSEDSLMFRFPKADLSYTYQGGSSTADATIITRENPGQLLISELVDRTDPDGDDGTVYNDEQGEERTITVELTQTGNNYYIIGNPYTAPMSMKEFMDKNTTFVGYWTESTYGPVVGTTDGTSWGTADCLIAPYSAFFVTTDEDDLNPLDDSPVTVTFTKDMQTFELDETSTSSPVRRQTNFAIRAKGEGGTTSASIAYADKATDDYRAGEDAVLMEDVSWQRDGMPLVYTVAGDKAVSVNALKQLTLIPVGAFADEGSLYTLSFVGVDMLESPVLVDVYEDTETPLTEGYTLEVEGATHGRYFIKVGTPILTEIDETASPVLEVSAYSPVQRTVVVSSDAGLESVEIYSVGGMLLNRTSIGGSLSCTLGGVPSGIAIVKVKTTEGTTVKKIRVR